MNEIASLAGGGVDESVAENVANGAIKEK